MVGTHVYSILFFAGAGILTILAIWYSITKIWIPTGASILHNPNDRFPIVISLIKTIVVVAILIVALTLAWNAKQSITTTMSTYETPAETREQKRVRESILPEQSEMDATRTEQKEKAETKPHQDALDSFDKNMEEEAKKIRQRSNTEKQ